ncbi:unnamed protein product [Protopolystoma xenopodis]|uniref:Uncharacterized protein n=1 Tax=Protopolystoma xenopodis TaxID=117903 RepID=A0A448XLX9_9PLAT|nr:unnamed protein product [Protopolystoma xenopodis]
MPIYGMDTTTMVTGVGRGKSLTSGIKKHESDYREAGANARAPDSPEIKSNRNSWATREQEDNTNGVEELMDEVRSSAGDESGDIAIGQPILVPGPVNLPSENNTSESKE